MSKITWRYLLSFACCSLLLMACSTAPPRALTEQIAKTDASIQQAEQAGVQSGGLPDLQMAKDKRAQAQEAVTDHKYDVAMRYAQQAQVDAQYASRKAEANLAIQSASELRRSNQTLHDTVKNEAATP